jgi:hypothetical protein
MNYLKRKYCLLIGERTAALPTTPLCSVVLGTAKLLNDFKLLRRIAVD